MISTPRIRERLLRVPLRLVPSRHAGESLDRARLDEMYALRSRIFALQPTKDPADDRAKFDAFVGGCQRVLLLRCRDGALRGMLCFAWERLPGKGGLVFVPEYGFFEPEFRGDPALILGGLPILARAMLAARGRPLWMAGIGYPKSMRAGARLLNPLWSLADPDLPDDARAVLETVLARHGGPGSDPKRGTVPMPTVPEPPPPPERQGSFWRRYESLNPDWPRGVGLVMAGRVDGRIFARIAADLTRRRRRRGASRRS